MGVACMGQQHQGAAPAVRMCRQRRKRLLAMYALCGMCTHKFAWHHLVYRLVSEPAASCPLPAPPANAPMPLSVFLAPSPSYTPTHTHPRPHLPARQPLALQVPPALCQGALGHPGCAGVQIHPGRQGRQRRHLQPLAPVQPQGGGGGAHAVWQRSHQPLCHGEAAEAGTCLQGWMVARLLLLPILLLLLLAPRSYAPPP
jgi:hypothetical protein